MAAGRRTLGGIAAAGGVGLALAVILPLRFAHPYWTAVLFLALQPIPIYATGMFAFRRAPEHPTARRLLLVGSLYGIALGCEGVLGALYASRGAFSGMWLLDLAVQVANLTSLVFAARLFGLFPQGVFERRYERIALGALWVLAAAPLALLLGHATLVYEHNLFLATPEVANPVAVPGLSALGAVGAALNDLAINVLFVGLVLLLLRFRRSGRERRDQIKWVLYAVALMVAVQLVPGLLAVSGLLSRSASEAAAPYLNDPILAVTLAATAFALFRRRALDVDLVIRRSLVYGALWLVIFAAYVGVAAAFGIAAGSRLPLAIAILLTIAVTTAFQPLRRRLEGMAGRLVYGRRLTGYEFLSKFGETLEHAFDVGELAPRIAMAVSQGLDVRWARVSIDMGAAGTELEPAGAAGIGLDEPAKPEAVVALTHGGKRLGAIECGPKVEGRFTPADHELLSTVARQAALGVHNGRLAVELSARLDEIRRQAEELAASRARIVQAQDAERRRIERDIHDGVQQEIVALMASLRLARNQLRRDPAVADAMLAELQGEARQTLEDIRDLAQGIHPAVLADRGLVEAIEADPALRGARYAEDIEGAAYFLVSEGLANVLKHAAASRASVRLAEAEGRLQVEVSDDGVGFVPAEATGSGLTGLRDRIEAVGGVLVVTAGPGEGSSLRATLPARTRERSGV